MQCIICWEKGIKMMINRKDIILSDEKKKKKEEQFVSHWFAIIPVILSQHISDDLSQRHTENCIAFIALFISFPLSGRLCEWTCTVIPSYNSHHYSDVLFDGCKSKKEFTQICSCGDKIDWARKSGCDCSIECIRLEFACNWFKLWYKKNKNKSANLDRIIISARTTTREKRTTRKIRISALLLHLHSQTTTTVVSSSKAMQCNTT